MSVPSHRAVLKLGAAVILAAACSDPPLEPASPATPAAYSLASTTAATYASQLDAGKCITAANAEVGAPVVIMRCTGDGDQQFRWSGTELRFGALCVDAARGQGNDGDAILLWTCHGLANQQWSFTAAGELRGINDKCIDIPYATATSGRALILYTCHGGANQKWTRRQDADGATVIITPGDDIQEKVDAHPEGTTFLLRAGVHRMQQITPKNGQQFVGEPGAGLSGGQSADSLHPRRQLLDRRRAGESVTRRAAEGMH